MEPQLKSPIARSKITKKPLGTSPEIPGLSSRIPSLRNLEVKSDISSYLNKSLPDIQDLGESISVCMENVLGNGFDQFEVTRHDKEVPNLVPRQVSIATLSESLSSKSKSAESRDLVSNQSSTVSKCNSRELSESSLKMKPGATVNKFWQSIYRTQLGNTPVVQPSMTDLKQPSATNDSAAPNENHKESILMDQDSDSYFKEKDIVGIEERASLQYSSSQDSFQTAKPTPQSRPETPTQICFDIKDDPGIEFELGNVTIDPEASFFPISLDQELLLEDINESSNADHPNNSHNVSSRSSLLGPREQPLQWSFQTDKLKTSTTTREFSTMFNKAKSNTTITAKFKSVFQRMRQDGAVDWEIKSDGRDLDKKPGVVRGPREL